MLQRSLYLLLGVAILSACTKEDSQQIRSIEGASQLRVNCEIPREVGCDGLANFLTNYLIDCYDVGDEICDYCTGPKNSIGYNFDYYVDSDDDVNVESLIPSIFATLDAFNANHAYCNFSYNIQNVDCGRGDHTLSLVITYSKCASCEGPFDDDLECGLFVNAIQEWINHCYDPALEQCDLCTDEATQTLNIPYYMDSDDDVNLNDVIAAANNILNNFFSSNEICDFSFTYSGFLCERGWNNFQIHIQYKTCHDCPTQHPKDIECGEASQYFNDYMQHCLELTPIICRDCENVARIGTLNFSYYVDSDDDVDLNTLIHDIENAISNFISLNMVCAIYGHNFSAFTCERGLNNITLQIYYSKCIKKPCDIEPAICVGTYEDCQSGIKSPSSTPQAYACVTACYIDNTPGSTYQNTWTMTGMGYDGPFTQTYYNEEAISFSFGPKCQILELCLSTTTIDGCHGEKCWTAPFSFPTCD